MLRTTVPYGKRSMGNGSFGATIGDGFNMSGLSHLVFTISLGKITASFNWGVLGEVVNYFFNMGGK